MRRATVLTMLIWAAPMCAHAQIDEARVAQARAHFDRADAAYGERDYATALAEYDQAYALMAGHPNQGMILYNSARCHHRLGQYADALHDYRQFLIEAPDGTEFRDDARTRVRELEVVVAAGGTAPELDEPMEGSVANWLIAAGLVALAVPAVAIPTWTLATEGECVDMDALGCREQVRFGAVDGVLFGLAGAAVVTAVIFATVQPIQVAVQLSPTAGGVRLRGSF